MCRWMIPGKPFKQKNCDCGKTTTTSAWLFLMKKIQRMSEGYQKDVRMTSRGCRDKDSKKINIFLEDVQRISKGYPEDVQRASRGVQRISRGRIVDV